MLKARGVAVTFGQKRVLAGVSASLAVGDRVALLGASGSGKTTFLRVLCGLLRPGAGQVFCDDELVVSAEGEAPDAQPRLFPWPKITMVFQDLRLFPNLTGQGNCLLGLDEARFESQLIDYSERLGVLDCLGRRPSGLSQGEMQRLAIIRALLRAPKFLLLDEPTAALDQRARIRLVDLLLSDSGSREMGILVVTHDLRLAAEFSTIAWFMHDGILVDTIEPQRVASLF